MKKTMISQFRNVSIVTLSALMVLSACKKGDEPSVHHGGSESPYTSLVSIDSRIEQGVAKAGARKVHLGEDNTSNHSLWTDILWSSGDEVACWSAYRDAKQRDFLWAPYQLLSGENTTSATFRGKAVHVDDDRPEKVGYWAEHIDYALFPLSAAVRSGEGKILEFPGDLPTSIYFTMPSVQFYEAPINNNPTFGKSYNVMTGKVYTVSAEQKVLRFTSTGGVLMLRIKGSSFIRYVQSLTLTSANGNDKLWGKFSAAIGDLGRSTVEYVSGAETNGNVLTLYCNQDRESFLPLPTDAYTNFYFVLPYGTLKQGFTITMEVKGATGDAVSTATITTSRDNTIIQSDIKVMPALELTENVSLTWSLDDLYEQGTVTEL